MQARPGRDSPAQEIETPDERNFEEPHGENPRHALLALMLIAFHVITKAKLLAYDQKYRALVTKVQARFLCRRVITKRMARYCK